MKSTLFFIAFTVALFACEKTTPPDDPQTCANGNKQDGYAEFQIYNFRYYPIKAWYAQEVNGQNITKYQYVESGGKQTLDSIVVGQNCALIIRDAAGNEIIWANNITPDDCEDFKLELED
jgi:hypothetical protein